ncbi:MAG: T9SS type A sorting domain-containing protein, partial [Crocinitomicaceae bacterium]
LCFGDTNGTASVFASGGTAPINIDWGTNDSSMLTPGYSTYTLTDNFGCSKTDSVFINEPTPLVLTLTQQEVLCFGDSTGSATAFISGGTPSYNVLWSNGETTDTASGLPAGGYSVNVSDVNGCSIQDSLLIDAPVSAVDIVLTGQDVLCFGDSTGSANALISGGTPSYTITWSTGDTTNTANGLTTGWYSVNASDVNGCSVQDSLLINAPISVVDMVLTGQDVLCFGDSTGSANALISGGTPSYNITWSTGDTTDTVNGLTVGWYSVNVSDVNGCSIQDSLEITEPPILSLTGITNDEFFGNDGSIDVTISGGTVPYSISWTNGLPAVEDPSGLTFGSYEATVTDDQGCTISQVFVVNSQVGISELSQPKFTIFPNPNEGRFNLILSSSYEFLQVEIINSLGQVIYNDELSGSSKEIQLDAAQVGVYLVRLFNDELSTVRRVVIK